mgnify:CR=1 FL=1
MIVMNGVSPEVIQRILGFKLQIDSFGNHTRTFQLWCYEVIVIQSFSMAVEK